MNGFTSEEVESYVPLVRGNVILNCLRLIDGTSRFQIKFDNEENMKIAEKIKSLDPNLAIAAREFDTNPHIGDAIKKLWNDSGIRTVSLQ